jgi:hypothetical protein
VRYFRRSRTIRTWGILLLALVSFAWPIWVGSAAMAGNYQAQTITPCLRHLHQPQLYTIAFQSSNPSVSSEAWEQYLVAVPAGKSSCQAKSLKKATLITIQNGSCRILTKPERIKIAQRLFKHRHQNLHPVQSNNYAAAAADLVNYWEQERKVNNQDQEPLLLDVADAWIFAELKLSLPNYVPVKIQDCPTTGRN